MDEPETGDTQGLDNEKLARWAAKATALMQEWQQWKEERERARKEEDRQFYPDIVETMNAERI